MFYISDESLNICLFSNSKTVGDAIRIAISKLKNQKVEIDKEEGSEIFANLLLQQNEKYTQRKKEISEIRRNSRKKN